MKKELLFIVLLCFLSFPFRLSAHHSTNANFTQEIISVDGVIERVRFQNPHASVLIKNTDEQGKETFWLIESGARTTLERQGVSLDILKVGAKVKPKVAEDGLYEVDPKTEKLYALFLAPQR